LIGSNTINTVPQQTLEAVKDHGKTALTVEQGLDDARAALADLEALGLSLDQATDEVESEGVEAFSKSIHALFATIEERSKTLVA